MRPHARLLAPGASVCARQCAVVHPRRSHSAVGDVWVPGKRLDVFCLLYLLLGPVCTGAVIGSALGKLAAVAGFAYLALALLRFARWRDETEHAKRFFAAFAALVLWLLFENCCIWAVSASDLRKHEHTQPLQDNMVLAFKLLQAQLPPWAAQLLVDVFKHEWISIKEKLVALIALGFAAVFDEVPYSGFGMCTRTVACIACARAIRTAAFMLTVVPSPRPGCYAGRFPPVPDTALEFFHIGFAKLRSGGGCNDLILSGHGVIYSAVVCAFSEFYPGWTSKLLWLALIRSNIRGPLTLQHYSVDMFLATAVTWLTWHACAWVYPARESRLRRRKAGQGPDPKGALQWLLTGAVFVVLLVLAVIIIAGGA